MEQRFGWVEWNGGNRPVPIGTKVKWMTREERDGERSYKDSCDTLNSDSYWKHDEGRADGRYDIVAYKIIRDAAGNLVNADVKEDPVSLFRSAPASVQGYGSPLPTIALNTMVPPVSGEDLVSAAVDPRFAAASYGNDLMVSGYPYAAPAGDPHEMVTFHELPEPIPTEDLQPYSNVISLPVREMASVSAGPRAGDSPPVGVGSQKLTNPKDMVGTKKSPFSVVPLTVVAEMGVGMLEGASKYGRHNFRCAGIRESVYFDATMRHLIAYWEGEDIDPDSGLSHLTKAMCSLAVWRDAQIQGMATDDRPPRSQGFFARLNAKAAEIIDRYGSRNPRHYTIEDTGRKAA